MKVHKAIFASQLPEDIHFRWVLNRDEPDFFVSKEMIERARDSWNFEEATECCNKLLDLLNSYEATIIILDDRSLIRDEEESFYKRVN